MSHIIEQMQAYYCQRAPIYDISMGYDDPRTVARLNAVIQRIRDLLQNKRVLEIACGPCFWTALVSSAATSILATDYNESTLAEARHKALDWDKVSLQIANAYDLSALPTAFDAAMAIDWFAHVPRSRFHEFLLGLHAKLEADSTVVLCDQLPGPQSLTGLYDEEGNHLQVRVLPDGSSYQVIKHFLSDDEISSILSPYASHTEIQRLPECGRVVVSYRLTGGKF